MHNSFVGRLQHGKLTSVQLLCGVGRNAMTVSNSYSISSQHVQQGKQAVTIAFFGTHVPPSVTSSDISLIWQ